MSCIAVLNAGSSSIKFALYADGTGDELLFKGQVEKIGTAPRMKASSAAGEKLLEREWPADELDHRAGTNVILQACLELLDGKKVAEGQIPKTEPFVFSGDEGTDVGLDAETNVSPDYKPNANAFTGNIVKVTVEQK